MLPSLLRRTLLPTLTTLSLTSIRPASTMAASPTAFTLDKAIFNPTLYARMRAFWFGDLSPSAATPSFDAAQKWFGVGKSEQEKEAFDGECRQNFVHALEAVGPERLALPRWEGYEREVEQAGEVAAPFLPEIGGAQAEDEKKGADTLLALIILLDQMPRNIYRDPAGLRKVYTHYDRLAFTLLHASMQLPNNPVNAPFYRRKPVYKTWFRMPLLHSEHLPSHDLWSQLVEEERKAIVSAGEQEALGFLEKSVEAEEKHVDLLRRFGRYPHRNGLVGRQTTAQEAEWLREGDTFGVKVGGGEEGKSEL